MQRLEAIVGGRVQGVMYRDFACRKGRGLKLVGYAQNLPEGTVHVVAEGERAQLERYLLKLHNGSLLSRVESVVSEWREATGEFRSFSIRY